MNDGGSKVTTICPGDDCEVCKLVNKLNDSGYQAAWKFRKYDTNKLLVKVGDVSGDISSVLKSGQVYVLYVNNKFVRKLATAINSSLKYNKDKIALMMDGSQQSAGFEVTISKEGKSTDFVFNFQPEMRIPGIDLSTVFGSLDNLNLETLGYFSKKNFNKEKYESAASKLRKIYSDHLGNNNPEVKSALETVEKELPKVEEVTKPTKIEVPIKVDTEVEKVTIQPEVTAPVDGCNDFGSFKSDDPKCFTCTKKIQCVTELMNKTTNG